MALLLHQICAKIPPVHKALQAAYFPPGYKFYFHSIDAAKYNYRTQAHDKLEGLLIVSPLGRRCYSVESVMRSCKSLSSLDISPQKFYEYVGIELTDGETELLWLTKKYKEKNPKKRALATHATHDHTMKRSREGLEEVSQGKSSNQCEPLTAEELYNRRCNRCNMCRRKDCGKCITCSDNAGRTRRYKEVCLHKVLEFTFLYRFHALD